MKILTLIVLSLILTSSALATQSREDKQAELDATCEVERQKKLTPMRQQFVEDCVTNKEKSDRDHCERFYADYGSRMGGRAPLFYDLPECVSAFDFHRSSRSGD